MFILSNNKFLLAVFAMAACMASSANAEGTGARVRRRKLKSGKSSKSTKGGTNSANTNSVTFDPNALIPAPVTVFKKSSLEQMREKCPVEAYMVQSCDSQNPKMVCEMCVLGQVNIHQDTMQGSIVDHSGLRACNKLSHCEQCSFEDIENLFNCEMGLNTTGTNTNSTSTNSNSPTTPDMTTPATGTSGGGVSAEVSSGGGPITGYHPLQPLPFSVCPADLPTSGDICDTGGYEYSKCHYPGFIECTCHYIPNNRFMCLENDDN